MAESFLEATSQNSTMREDKENDLTTRKKNLQEILRPDRLPFLPPLAAWMIRLLHASCRFTILGKEHLDATVDYPRPAVFAAWHYAFPVMIYFFRDRNGILMVSRSRDGEWIARVLRHLGFETARGSMGKGGAAALRKVLSHLGAGYGAGLIADGSLGPPCVAQKGVLLLARYSGVPLVPISMAAHPCWRFPSWDRTVLAKPFSRIILAVGSPMWIDRQASPQQMEALRQELEDRINRLTQEAWAALPVKSGKHRR